jgi:hypothetical protein
LYVITEYQYQQLHNTCKDAFVDEIGRQPLKEESQTTDTQQVQSKIAQQIMLSYKELFGNDFNSAANLAAHVVARLSDMH